MAGNDPDGSWWASQYWTARSPYPAPDAGPAASRTTPAATRMSRLHRTTHAKYAPRAMAAEPITERAQRLFAGLGGDYDRWSAWLSFGQDPRWRRCMVSHV